MCTTGYDVRRDGVPACAACGGLARVPIGRELAIFSPGCTGEQDTIIWVQQYVCSVCGDVYNDVLAASVI